jgi:hypothetical protein
MLLLLLQMLQMLLPLLQKLTQLPLLLNQEGRLLHFSLAPVLLLLLLLVSAYQSCKTLALAACREVPLTLSLLLLDPHTYGVESL